MRMPNLESRGGRIPPESFETIEEAVLESPRGRWFLAEYASRLRVRETRAVTDQVKSLEIALAANHDAVMSRIASALGRPSILAQAPATALELASKHMKFFKRDEEIFEAAPQAAIAAVPATPLPPESRGAKLTIRRLTGTEAVGAEPLATPPAAAIVAAEVPSPETPETITVGEAAPEAAPKRRIVIIRHKPGEILDVPLHTELAQAS
jgi:hypothetical protein